MKSKKIIAALVSLAAILLVIYVAFTTDIVSGIKKAGTNIGEAYKEIREFFDDGNYSSEERGTITSLAASQESTPMVISSPHTELIPSPFNSIDDVYTLSSIAEAEISERGTEALPESEKLGYESIPLFADNTVSSVMSILKAHGISVNTISITNTAPQGEVFAIRYSGKSDENGYYINPAVAVTLYVSAPKKAATVPAGDNLVYLTFDDGPYSGHTEALLDILDTYGIKGSFFTVGTSVEKHPELVKMILDRGHAVGCHTMTHVYTDIYASVASLENELTEWENLLLENDILPEDTKLFRFPGGSVGKYFDSYTRNAMLSMLESHGYLIYDWNVSTNDAVLFLADEDENAYDYIKKSFIDSLEIAVKQNSGKTGAPIIVLMHESSSETPELLKWIIEYFTRNGYSFGSLASMGESYTFAQQN